MRPLFSFRIGSYVNIVGVPQLSNIKVDYVSDSGVHVHGSFGNTVLSGHSPAVEYKAPKVNDILPNNNSMDQSPVNKSKNLSSKIKMTDKLKAILLPDHIDFTIKDVAETNDIPYPYASKWVKENCVESGIKEKPAGQKGRASKLYRLKAK